MLSEFQRTFSARRDPAGNLRRRLVDRRDCLFGRKRSEPREMGAPQREHPPRSLVMPILENARDKEIIQKINAENLKKIAKHSARVRF